MTFLYRRCAEKTSSVSWDAEIPMEYYEESFLEYKDYLNVTGQCKQSTPEDLHTNSNYVLQSFKRFEKFQKKEDRKEWKKYVRRMQVQKVKQEKLSISSDFTTVDRVKKVS